MNKMKTDRAKSPRVTNFVEEIGRSPRLLVSVRSRQEADCALVGGAEILDIKEPSLGSLGMAHVDEIASIASHPSIVSGDIPLSVALGELSEWPLSAAIPSLPAEVTFAKLGLSQCARQADWQADWLRVRRSFERQTPSRLRWVAVAYADCSEAGSPGLMDVLNAAIETNCAGLLIDTWTKDGRVLLDEIRVAELMTIANKCHHSGLFLALAGRLRRDLLPSLSEVGADILAIRSAACRNNDRTSELHAECVVEFKRALHQQRLPGCDESIRRGGL